MSEMTLQELKDSLTPQRIIELVSELGSDEYQEKADCIIFKTICHNACAADASLKLYYYKNTKLFHCYTDCGETFNIFGLFERRYDLLGIEYNFFKDIVLKIAGNSLVKKKTKSFIEEYTSNYDKYERHSPRIELPHIKESLLNVYTFCPTIEWLNEGISKEAHKHYNILYSIKENKIIIPHYDLDDNLIGIRGRALNEEDLLFGKYMPVQIEGEYYAHPLSYNLYGLNIVKDNIKKYEMAIVAEGEKSCLLYETMFGREQNICVAACGSNFQRYQLELLLKCGAKRVLIAFDKEGDTLKKQQKYYDKMKNICEKYSNICQMGFIWDSCNLLDLKDSPFDKGKKVAEQLIRQGVWL